VSLDFIFDIVWIIVLFAVGICASYARQERLGLQIIPTLEEQLNNSVLDLADKVGWAILIYPSLEGPINYNNSYSESRFTQIDVVERAVVALLGRLRDGHPDPLVADKAVELLNAMHYTTTTIHT
jgi:hypothetical protein